MRLHNMDQKTIDQRVVHAEAHHLEFVIRYWTLLGGSVTVPGKDLTQPLPSQVAFMEWNRGHWQHTGLLISTSDIEAIWTEYDDCPNCGDFLADLDGFGPFEEPICEVCAREAWESERTEGVIADGGVL